MRIWVKSKSCALQGLSLFSVVFCKSPLGCPPQLLLNEFYFIRIKLERDPLLGNFLKEHKP